MKRGNGEWRGRGYVGEGSSMGRKELALDVGGGVGRKDAEGGD